jgi:DNA-binding transcriptional ArsR family regulator
MIERLLDGQEHTSGELAGAAGITSGTTGEHLGILVEAGLVQVRRDGRFHRVRIADQPLDAVAGRGWLDRSGSALSDAGRRGLTTVGVDVEGVEPRKRPTLLVCVDWTERRPHLSGGVGAAQGQCGFAEELGVASVG